MGQGRGSKQEFLSEATEMAHDGVTSIMPLIGDRMCRRRPKIGKPESEREAGFLSGRTKHEYAILAYTILLLTVMEGLPHMESHKVLDFPLRRPELFCPEVDARVLATGKVGRVLYAAIRALPHVADAQSRQELQQALCELIFQDAA